MGSSPLQSMTHHDEYSRSKEFIVVVVVVVQFRVYSGRYVFILQNVDWILHHLIWIWSISVEQFRKQHFCIKIDCRLRNQRILKEFIWSLSGDPVLALTHPPLAVEGLVSPARSALASVKSLIEGKLKGASGPMRDELGELKTRLAESGSTAWVQARG